MKRISKYLLMIVVASFVAFYGCKKEEYKPNDNARETYDESNLYLGVVGFNDKLHFYESADYHFVPIANVNIIENYVNSLSMANGTLLYYSVDSALNVLEGANFPDDLESVSIITFTDGLDQGSGIMNSKYSSSSAYLNAMHGRITSEKVNGKSINAYSIGILGEDVTDKIQFAENLSKLASSSLNVTEVTKMDDVKRRFQLLAYEIKSNLTTNLALQITTPYDGTKIRFTFDYVENANLSTSYLEGIYKDKALTDISYVGCSSTSGSSVQAVQSGIHSTISFESLRGLQDAFIETGKIQQWEYSENISGWQKNSEFSQNADIEYTKSSVIMLVLDCSSSLKENFFYMKEYVKEFLEILNGTFEGTIVIADAATVTTAEASDIETTSAIVGGNVTSDGGAEVTDRGICWSTSSNPTLSDNVVRIGSGNGEFSTQITDLEEETTYYARAYAVNSEGTSYGDVVLFTTLVSEVNASLYVDLGLSIKWATCNIGASKPEEYGEYYAWGEIATKSIYNWTTYKYGSARDKMTKYCTDDEFGTNIDDKTTLEKSDDVAYTTLGGNWRMPTDAEWTELRENCTWTWVMVNGVNGYKVSATNGNYIFLPAAGVRCNSGLSDVESYGSYWSSSLESDNPSYAWNVYFKSNNVCRSYYYRSYGQSVRPVLAE